MLLEIAKYPDFILARKCSKVVKITSSLRTFINDMVETMYENDGVGLAAPQVGHSIQLITLDDTGPKERNALRVFLNPVIIESCGEEDSEESCLSVPLFSTKIKRKARLTIKALDENGQDVCCCADGLLAVILQHEIDHLNGVTIVDYAGRLKRAMYNKKVANWLKYREKND